MQLRPETKIGEYQILDVIGSGGFSVVYKAQDLNLDRLVAIKQLSPEVFSEAGSRDWFVREARLAASLSHPNIVATYALREKGESLFLVMEYLPGGDLHSLIQASGPLERSVLLKIASNVCHALEALHARNVIHRDIKPENILIGPEGDFKLADFGLAHIRQAHQHSLNSASGPQPGTLLYMSPEQALGEQVTVRSDIYSLAVVLYEAMTGHYYLDFDLASGDESTLLTLIAEANPIYPETRRSSVPGEIVDLLLRTLNKDPRQRPANAREFLSEIRSAVSRSRHTTLSQKRRTLTQQPTPPAPELLRDLYAVRTVRDADHRPDQALVQLRLIWEAYPSVPEVAAEYGETLIALGRADEGRDWLERAIRLKPDLPFAQLALADLYRNIDENEDEANDAIITAIRADADLAYAVLYDDIVSSLNEPDTYENFVSLFRRAAEEQPTAPICHNLGQVLALSERHHRESIGVFEAAINLDPGYGPAFVGLASLLIELNRYEMAIPLFEQACRLDFPELPPEDWHKAHTVYQRPHVSLALAVAYVQINEIENSVRAACEVLAAAPDELEEDIGQLLQTYITAAQRWIEEGDNLRAYRLLDRAIPLAAHWGNVEIFTLLGLTQSKIGAEYRRKRQWDDAVGWLKAGLSNLQKTQAHSHKARHLAVEVRDELEKAQQRHAR